MHKKLLVNTLIDWCLNRELQITKSFCPHHLHPRISSWCPNLLTYVGKKSLFRMHAVICKIIFNKNHTINEIYLWLQIRQEMENEGKFSNTYKFSLNWLRELWWCIFFLLFTFEFLFYAFSALFYGCKIPFVNRKIEKLQMLASISTQNLT